MNNITDIEGLSELIKIINTAGKIFISSDFEFKEIKYMERNKETVFRSKHSYNVTIKGVYELERRN